jgi:hypothetical protein
MRPATTQNYRLTVTLPLVCTITSSSPYGAENRQGQPSALNESSSLLSTGNEGKINIERRGTLVKAALYAVQVFYSFFIM